VQQKLTGAGVLSHDDLSTDQKLDVLRHLGAQAWIVFAECKGAGQDVRKAV